MATVVGIGKKGVRDECSRAERRGSEEWRDTVDGRSRRLRNDSVPPGRNGAQMGYVWTRRKRKILICTQFLLSGFREKCIQTFGSRSNGLNLAPCV